MATTNDSHVAKLAGQAGGTAAADHGYDDSLPEVYPVLSVRNESPALATARCVKLGTNNTTALLLPQDPRRRSALVLAIDNDVYVASSLELAQAVEGATTGSDAFYLSKGVPLPVTSKAALWVACTTTGSSSRVSVLVEKDDE